MGIQLPDARQLSDEVLEAFRMRAIRGCELGFSQTDVAEMLGVSRETVSRWCAAFQRGGLDAVPHDRTGRPRGSGRLLSDEQGQQVQELLDRKSPDELGIASPLWTRRAVRELIVKTCGVKLALRTVGKYLQEWGYTPQKPSRKNASQDPQAVQAWLGETYPALAARAEREDAEIHWGDELGVGMNDYSERGYSRIGHTPELKVSGQRFRINMLSTITNGGKVHFMTYPGMLDSALFLVFLDRLLRLTNKKVFLIVDRLRAHKSAAVQEWLASRKERIEIFYLPCGAPELNPDEYLNHDTKAAVNAGKLPSTRDELQSNLNAFMLKLAQLPRHVMAYFQHPCANYAAENM